MKRFLFAFSVMMLWGGAVQSETARITYGQVPEEPLPVDKLQPEEDDLYSGAEIQPLEKVLSEAEQKQENSTDVEFIEEEDKLPDLACDSPNLKKQVEQFIYNHINEKATNSVVEKRARILLVNNMNDFTDVTNEKNKDKKNFSVEAGAAYLKINRRREIHKICRSSENNAPDFEDIYIIIYPFANYYKVAVTNLMPTIEEIDKATFIYNW